MRQRRIFLSTLSLRRATGFCLGAKADSVSFLSTLSLRRATVNNLSMSYSVEISIHALLAESDYRAPPYNLMIQHFYPRSPCGERRLHSISCMTHMLFLSTLSLRRATKRPKHQTQTQKFLSTLSLRRATKNQSQGLQKAYSFLSTLSLRRATQWCPFGYFGRNYFYPRSPCGERQ